MDRKMEMDAVRTAEFKEAFDEFDKVNKNAKIFLLLLKLIKCNRITAVPFLPMNFLVCSEPWDKTPLRMNYLIWC